MEKLIDSLKILGLSRYEAEAYIALNRIISGKAIDVSEASGIPRSKVYDVLKELNKKNFVDIEGGKPLKYIVIPPKIAFKKRKEELIKDLTECEEELNDIYDNKISQAQAPVWLINSSEKIIKKELEIIDKTKKSINMRIGFLLKGEAEELIRSFRKLPNNVEIKILASENCYIDKEKVEIINKFKKANLSNLTIMKADIPFVKLIIRDGKEMFHTYVQFTGKEKSVNQNTAMGVWNKYPEICKNYDERFINQFNNIENKKGKKKNKESKK